jgi:pimeloyl-ACP methyl ester carboxylesterase
MAHTLVYETKILGNGSLPTELAASVAVPTLVIAGGESFAYMRETALALAQIIPDARARVLEGQTHDIAPRALAPVLDDFFAAR